MRIDLGVIQMELGGRPDMPPRRTMPKSLLDALEATSRPPRRRKPRNGVEFEDPFALDSRTCMFCAFMREGTLSIIIATSLAFHLRRFTTWSSSDTDPDHRLFAFVVRHAARRQRDKRQFELVPPYVLMMNAR